MDFRSCRAAQRVQEHHAPFGDGRIGYARAVVDDRATPQELSSRATHITAHWKHSSNA